MEPKTVIYYYSVACLSWIMSVYLSKLEAPVCNTVDFSAWWHFLKYRKIIDIPQFPWVLESDPNPILPVCTVCLIKLDPSLIQLDLKKKKKNAMCTQPETLHISGFRLGMTQTIIRDDK